MRLVPALCVLAATGVAGVVRPAASRAQVEAGFDAGASLVKYDGFLASGAASLTPSVTYRSPRFALGARGTVLVFESGNSSVQGLLSGSGFSRSLGALRAEVTGEAGSSAYASFARFAHLLVRLRMHALGRRRGAWGGPVVGRLSRGAGARAVSGASAGLWAQTILGAASVSWTGMAIGDTAYHDIEGRLRWRRATLDVEGAGGVRLSERGGGQGAYGDVSVAVRLSEVMGLVVAGGRYPSDPTRGNIPGRYLTFGLRIAPRPAPRVAVVQSVSRSLVAAGSDIGPAVLPGARLTVESLDGLQLLVLRVPAARRAEVMGDFTNWQAVPLVAAGAARFEFAVRLAPGLYRFNVRVDGGAWGVPGGVDVAADEFGGSVGVLVVP